MRRRPVLIGAVAVGVVFVAFTVVLATRLERSPDYRGTALLGDPVPDLVLPSLTGKQVALRDTGGRAVIVNFFNSWCVPCKEEEPSLLEFWDRHEDDPSFWMVGIVRDDTESAVRRHVREKDFDWTILLDPGGRASVDFGTTGQPETYAVSPDGTIAAKHLGRATTDDLERMLAHARGEEVPE
jgi:cytochrome c biogenesis protein CcmG/thiol:disulfide interchange protein DsbE